MPPPHQRPTDDHDADLVELLGGTAPNDSTRPVASRSRRPAVYAVLASVTALVVLILGIAGPFTSTPRPPVVTEAGQATVDSPSAPSAAASTVTPAQPVDAAQLGALTEATTFTTVSGAAQDTAPAAAPSGAVVHPTVKVAAYASPGGPAVAAIPVKQLGTSDTWLPVVGEQPGWVRVLLPSRPNNSTAWLAMTGSLTLARTPYQIKVDRAAFRLTLTRDGQQVAQWTVGIGKPSAITPSGRTFILASIKDPQQSWSPIVLPLGAHSDTHLTYGGGPGTVGVHTWPTADVYGEASSDGCLRVPPDALNLLSTEVPLGTPVLIH